MSQNFLACDRDQSLLLPPDLRDWLPADHLAWFVIETVSELDLGAFLADYRVDGHGRAAHDPEMMVAVLLYAYATGARSARVIESKCVEDVAFRVIAANQRPDHSTFARFRDRHQERLADLFGQVLGLCNRAGIVSGELLALDSTKIAANASGQVNRSYRQIAEEILADAARIDAAEDELYGNSRGDELPVELRDPAKRKEWIKRELEQGRRLKASEPNKRAERLAEAKSRLEEEHATRLQAEAERAAWRQAREAERAAEGKRMLGRPVVKEPLGFEPAGRINTTDLDSRPVKTHRGFIQGYNAQAVATPEQVIVSCELTQSSADGGQLQPMIEDARANLEAVGAAGPKTVLADAGYWSRAQIKELESSGIEALVPPEGHARTKPPTKAKRSGPYAQMRRKLRSERGSSLYRQRQTIIEPVFAQTKVIRGADRFQRRGLAACQCEWRLIAATHNLLKLWRAAPAPATG
jgi:transposase